MKPNVSWDCSHLKAWLGLEDLPSRWHILITREPPQFFTTWTLAVPRVWQLSLPRVNGLRQKLPCFLWPNLRSHMPSFLQKSSWLHRCSPLWISRSENLWGSSWRYSDINLSESSPCLLPTVAVVFLKMVTRHLAKTTTYPTLIPHHIYTSIQPLLLTTTFHNENIHVKLILKIHNPVGIIKALKSILVRRVFYVDPSFFRFTRMVQPECWLAELKEMPQRRQSAASCYS